VSNGANWATDRLGRCMDYLVVLMISGMWSRYRRLGLETVSRRINVSSRSRLGLGPKGLGVSSQVSDLDLKLKLCV